MYKEKLGVIRIQPHLHQRAKMRACEELMTLREWIEKLIISEEKIHTQEIREKSFEAFE